jgi:hypothetical protein
MEQVEFQITDDLVEMQLCRSSACMNIPSMLMSACMHRHVSVIMSDVTTSGCPGLQHHLRSISQKLIHIPRSGRRKSMSALGPDITTLQTENAALRHEIQGLQERVASLESNAGVQCNCTHVKQ